MEWWEVLLVTTLFFVWLGASVAMLYFLKNRQ